MARVLLLGAHAPSLVGFRRPLLATLRARGHEVWAAAARPDPELAARLEASLAELGVRSHFFEFERNYIDVRGDLRLLASLALFLRAHKIERLLTYTLKPNVYGGLAAAALRLPSAAMVTGLGGVLTAPTLAGTFARGLLRAACLHHDRVFVQNPDDRRDLVDGGIARAAQLVAIAGSGVELDTFTPRSLPETPAFLMLARLIAAKGVREYLEAGRILRARGYTWPLRLAGIFDPGSGGIPAAEIEAAVQAGHIEYLGELRDVRDALAACTIYVLPSWHEGTPRSALEAMACGRAVLTTDVRGCRETVIPGDTGLLVPPRDPEALAAAMIELAEDPARVAAMGRRGRALAESRFDANSVAAVIADALSL